MLFRTKTAILTSVFALMLSTGAYSAEAAKPVTANSDTAKSIVDYLIKNPADFEKIYKSYQDYLVQQEESKQKEQVKSLLDKLSLSKNNLVYANPKGKTNFILFADYECGYCRLLQKALDKISAEDKDLKITVVLVPIIGKDSKAIASYALAANKQGKFSELHKALMNKNGSTRPEDIDGIAKNLNINIDKLKKEQSDKDFSNILDNNIELAKGFDVDSLPTFIIGTKTYKGALSEETLKKEIAKARK